MTLRRIAVLGAGNMGRALIGGLLRSGTRAELIKVGESLPEARAQLQQELALTASEDNAAVVADAEIILLAVKPQQAASVLAPLAAALAARRPLLISIAAGVRVAQLRHWCGAEMPVVRAMPNSPALLGAGITGLYAPPEVLARERALAERLLQGLGEVVWVPEEGALDAVTALSGSGPAYCFLLAECMAHAGTSLGLEAATAQRLARATLYGAGLMAHAPGSDLARLREQVSSPGGTTEAALRVLQNADLRGTLGRALEAAVARSRELAAAMKP